jgi:hypothetical protein
MMTLRITPLRYELPSDDTAPEPLSPELVLVDPELARAARAHLAHAGDTLAFRPRLVVAPPARHARDQREVAAAAEESHERPARVVGGGGALQLYGARVHDDRWAEPLEDHAVGRRPRRWWRALAVASLWTVLGATGAYVFVSARTASENDGGSVIPAVPDEATHRATPPATRATDETVARPDRYRPATDDRSNRAIAPRTRASDQSVSPSADSPTAGQKRRPRRAKATPFPTRVFVWPPVARATFYKVEFFRHGARIFVAWPSKTRLVLPLQWTYRGRRFSLTRATYHWRVTPAFGSRSRPRYGIPSTRSTLVLR